MCCIFLLDICSHRLCRSHIYIYTGSCCKDWGTFLLDICSHRLCRSHVHRQLLSRCVVHFCWIFVHTGHVPAIYTRTTVYGNVYLCVGQPPPPGCPPNAAQLAAMQGQQVVATQRKGNFWVDGSGGGTSFW